MVISLARVQPLELMIYEKQRDSKGIWRPKFCANNHVWVGDSNKSANIRFDLGEAAIVRHPENPI
jgi:hypothetical protein